MAKYFIITIDTEGDNQWDLSRGISTENARYLPRFQDLCEKYSFKPVWLTNYEMAKDAFYVEYMRDCLVRGVCEVGMHLHAWYSPPEYSLPRVNQERAYLIEYPPEIMEAKVKFMTELLEDTFQRQMVSHRSGRWALNETYLALLHKYGYQVDCSVTPHVSWAGKPGCTGIPGSDYRAAPERPYYIYTDLLEVPVSIRKIRCFQLKRVLSLRDFLRECRDYIKGKEQWLRPDKFLSEKGMLRLVEIICKEDTDYLMFMMHSSELMPGGSNTFTTKQRVEELFVCMERLFSYIGQNYQGVTLKQYRELTAAREGTRKNCEKTGN
ncbi:hypothetical protein SPSYN_00833 [Sporotomaculum syntrophicum]|uniref:Deacetylase n=1 Tax=Sporotomaculum syntrophicum TaxID=182264 RepID=A0A9D3AWZ5_9FIRM|nr:deacetylase [Sporotomaculum syntrophicum]KAF1086095.1 hypothetical protein SPSYN_00833 [Sporotomaculum syntrophicum]